MASFDLDCLFVHAPKAENHYLPFGDFMSINYMPMGLPALAHWLRVHGLRSEIIHLGAEHIRDPSWRLVEGLSGMALRSVGLPLYWHYQSYDAIEVARALGRSHPESFIFLGGVTASYFAREILEGFPEIHAVVLGHGEGPVLELVRCLESGGDLGQVPNLLWRTPDGTLRDNRSEGVRYFARTPEVDELVFADLSVLRSAPIYAQSFGFPLAWSHEYSPQENRRRLNMGRPFFPLFTGRGCPWQCSFCGGNRDTLKRINGQGGVVWRSPAKVVEDIRRAMDWGYKTLSLCFDPTPTRDSYYVELFDQIHQARLGVDFYFECWGLPTRRFAEAFRRTFPSPESYLAVSPDAGDEDVRRRNKQPYYSNTELYEALDLLEELEISADVFYTLALPGEDLTSARRTGAQMRSLAERYRHLRRIMVWTVQLEPGSPQFERPQELGLETDRRSFQDYWRLHGGAGGDAYSGLGYKIRGYFGDARDQGTIADFERHLQHLKCMEMCFLSPDPRDFVLPEQGRAHCFERRVGLAARRGTPPPSRPIGEGFDYTDALAEEQRLRGPRPRRSWV